MGCQSLLAICSKLWSLTLVISTRELKKKSNSRMKNQTKTHFVTAARRFLSQNSNYWLPSHLLVTALTSVFSRFSFLLIFNTYSSINFQYLENELRAFFFSEQHREYAWVVRSYKRSSKIHLSIRVFTANRLCNFSNTVRI